MNTFVTSKVRLRLESALDQIRYSKDAEILASLAHLAQCNGCYMISVSLKGDRRDVEGTLTHRPGHITDVQKSANDLRILAREAQIRQESHSVDTEVSRGLA